MSRPKKSIEEVVRAELPEFAEEVAALSADELNGRLAQCAKDAEAVEQAKEDDEELAEASEKVTALSGPYKDGKKIVRLKTRYIISLLREKGAL